MRFRLFLSVLAAGALWASVGPEVGFAAKILQRASGGSSEVFATALSKTSCNGCLSRGRVTDLITISQATVPVGISLGQIRGEESQEAGPNAPTVRGLNLKWK